MPINLTAIEAIIALITIIVFLISIGKWIQMREAIAQRVIEVDEQLKEINDWRRNCPNSIDSVYVRKENCQLHMVNFDEKFASLTDSINALKKSLDRHMNEVPRRR